MNFNFFSRVSRLAAIGAILLGSASCVDINEELGGNLIPTDQKWDVFTPEAADLKEIRMQMSDSLSGYSTTRFTFGAINDSRFGTSVKSTSFTLVPLYDTLDFGKNTKIRQFHFTAVRDTLSVTREEHLKMLQNVHVSELKKALDSTVLYMGAFMNPEIRAEYLDTDNQITVGTPVYDGGDSLSFDFSREFAERFVEKVKKADLDSMNLYIEQVPGIYITTDLPAGEGGRINMFNLSILTSDGYVSGNYAQLKFTAETDDHKASEFSVCSGKRIKSELGHTGDGRESRSKILVQMERSLHRRSRLKRMQAGKCRHCSYFFIDLRIVFHCAASERIESGIHTEVHLRKVGVMTHHIKFAYARKSRSFRALKTGREFGNGMLPLVCRKRVSLPSCLGKVKDQFVVVLHTSSSLRYPTIASILSLDTFSVTQKFTRPGSTSTAPKTPII